MSITAQCEKWFSYSKDLATAAVYCCSTAKELPDLPSANSSGTKENDLFAAAYQSLGSSDKARSTAEREKEEEKERQKSYRKFRARNMGVDKARLEKLLLISEVRLYYILVICM